MNSRMQGSLWCRLQRIQLTDQHDILAEVCPFVPIDSHWGAQTNRPFRGGVNSPSLTNVMEAVRGYPCCKVKLCLGFRASG